jgi:hypothetical protein
MLPPASVGCVCTSAMVGSNAAAEAGAKKRSAYQPEMAGGPPHVGLTLTARLTKASCSAVYGAPMRCCSAIARSVPETVRRFSSHRRIMYESCEPGSSGSAATTAAPASAKASRRAKNSGFGST